MTHMEDCAILTQKYLRAKGQTISIEEILNRPHHKQVWYHWLAQAHFNINNHYMKIEDAPEGIERITVMGNSRIEYVWKGEYVRLQEVTKDDCEGIFGD